MESKITIDIRPTGEPFLYINYRPSEDLRDKVLGRFLCESVALNLLPDGSHPNHTPLGMRVLYSDQQTGRIEAMIEHVEEDAESIEFLNKMDLICTKSLDPDTYQRKWVGVYTELKELQRL